MEKKMKTRKGKDGFDYPYTSPDIVVDENGKSATTKFNEISTQFKDIANNYLNLKALGIKGDGKDESELLNELILSNKTKIIYLPPGTYTINSPLNLSSNTTFICDGELKYTGTDYGITLIDTENVKLQIKKLTSNGSGIKLESTSNTNMCVNNIISINEIKAQNDGVDVLANKYGIQYNDFEFRDIKSNNICIKIIRSEGWIGENTFKIGKTQGIHPNHAEYSIYIESNKDNTISGTNITHGAFEGVKNGIFIKNASTTYVNNIRHEESVDEYILILEEKAMFTQFDTQTIDLSKIKFDKLLGNHNTVRGTFLNTGGTYLGINEIDFCKEGLRGNLITNRYSSKPNKQVDETTPDHENFTVNLEDYTFPTFILVSDNCTLTLDKRIYNANFIKEFYVYVQSTITVQLNDGTKLYELPKYSSDISYKWTKFTACIEPALFKSKNGWIVNTINNIL